MTSRCWLEAARVHRYMQVAEVGESSHKYFVCTAHLQPKSKGKCPVVAMAVLVSWWQGQMGLGLLCWVPSLTSIFLSEKVVEIGACSADIEVPGGAGGR